MKAVKGFQRFNRRKLFVVLALNLFLSGSATLASPAGDQISPAQHAAKIIQGNGSSAIDWVLDASIGNVDFYHSITECNGVKAVFLKFNNKNTKPVKVSWKEVFVIKSGESKDGFSGKKELTLAAGITTPTDCEDKANKKSILLASEIDPTIVTEILNFSYKEITVDKP